MVTYTSVIGLYDDFQDAEQAVDGLIASGYRRDNISLITNDASGEYERYVQALDLDDDLEDPDEEEGSAFGAVIGTLTGLAVAVLPGVGPVFALGPLAAALISGIGAASGAVTGGLLGALLDLGTDEDDAQLYAEGVRRGGTLVVVRVADEDEDHAEDILASYNPIDVEDRKGMFEADGWSGFDESRDEPYDSDQVQQYQTEYTEKAKNNDAVMTAEVVEEEMKVGKREVQSGGVRVRKYVTEQDVTEDIELRREEVNVDRNSVNRSADDADLNAFEEETIVVTEHAEEAVVDKDARVVEEVEIYKDVDHETETIEGTVRRADVEVEHVNNTSNEAFSAHEDDFRSHFSTTYRDNDYSYEQYRPAYRYGYTLATRPEYQERDWQQVESDAQARWNGNNDGTWDDVKDAIQHAWMKTKQAIR